MKRENRYIVIKIKDAENCLSGDARCKLKGYLVTINAYRRNIGKPPLECVVIESDWPEYQKVWDMLAERVDGKGDEGWKSDQQ